MKILFLTSGPLLPTTRFRVLQYVPSLTNAGHRFHIAHAVPPQYSHFAALGWRGSQWLRQALRCRDAARAWLGRYDCVVIEREISGGPGLAVERLIRRAARALVLDVDDGVFLANPGRYQALVGMCDAVLAGNRAILQAILPNSPRGVVLPTCVDHDRYPLKRHTATTQPLVLGWTGTSSNLKYLAPLQRPLQRLRDRWDFRLAIISDGAAERQLPRWEGVPVDFVSWAPETEIAELLKFDIGLMPLLDEPWARYKCGLKALQYMAAGIPPVASPVGVNAEIIDHGRNGFLAATEEDWIGDLERLLASAELRSSLGCAARDTVRSRYSIAANYAVLETTLRNAAERGGGGRRKAARK